LDWIVLTPPVIAIVLALWSRQVHLSLLVGLWLGTTILADGNPIMGLRGMMAQLVAVFSSPGNTSVVIFCLLVGGLIALFQASGGVAGFVALAQRRGWGKTRRGAELLAWTVGMLIFVESSITSLTVGAVSRPFFEKLRIPREKLAYYCDATSAPVCMSIPLNAWGAYVLGLLAAQGLAADAVRILTYSIAFNFFAWLSIVFALVLAITGWRFGAMRRAEERAEQTGQVIREGSMPMIAPEVADIRPVEGVVPLSRYLIAPLFVMVAMIFVGLYITGDGNIMSGSGSTSVLWAVSTAIAFAMILYALPINKGRSIMPLSASTELVLRGSSGLVPVTVLIVLAFALGQVSRELQMGPYLVGLIGEGVPGWWLPALVFVVGCFVSFTLGSSWTTFAILMPIAVPLAQGLDIPIPLMVGALLSGGIYGDHASPLSDTSIISSMSAACDHVDHVNTQLPYTALVAGVSLLLFVIAGALLV
jgi:tetracycline resistance efflux pump